MAPAMPETEPTSVPAWPVERYEGRASSPKGMPMPV